MATLSPLTNNFAHTFAQLFMMYPDIMLSNGVITRTLGTYSDKSLHQFKICIKEDNGKFNMILLFDQMQLTINELGFNQNGKEAQCVAGIINSINIAQQYLRKNITLEHAGQMAKLL